MNLERVQKYYELIDRELGLESEDDLFGFESNEEDLFGFESDEDDLFECGFDYGAEGLKDVFGKAKSGVVSAFNKAKPKVQDAYSNAKTKIKTSFNKAKPKVQDAYSNAKLGASMAASAAQHKVKDAYYKHKESSAKKSQTNGTDKKYGFKGAIKKSFAFVMNVLRTIVSAASMILKIGTIHTIVKSFGIIQKAITRMSLNDYLDKIENLDDNTKNAVSAITTIAYQVNYMDVMRLARLYETVKSIKVNDVNFESKMKGIVKSSSFSNFLMNADANFFDKRASSAYAKIQKKEQDQDSRFWIRILNKHNIVTPVLILSTQILIMAVRKLAYYYQRKGETWFMQEADKKKLMNVKYIRNEAFRNLAIINKGAKAMATVAKKFVGDDSDKKK